jgi:hypothetical protein
MLWKKVDLSTSQRFGKPAACMACLDTVTGIFGTVFLDNEQKSKAARFSAAQSFLTRSVQYKGSTVGMCLLDKECAVLGQYWTVWAVW